MRKVNFLKLMSLTDVSSSDLATSWKAVVFGTSGHTAQLDLAARSHVVPFVQQVVTELSEGEGVAMAVTCVPGLLLPSLGRN